MLGFASVEEAMKFDLVSLHPDRASREAFLRLLREKGRLERDEAETVVAGNPARVLRSLTADQRSAE